MEPNFQSQFSTQSQTKEVFAGIPTDKANRIVALFDDLLTTAIRVNSLKFERFFEKTDKLLNSDQRQAMHLMRSKLDLDSEYGPLQSLGSLITDFLLPMGYAGSIKVGTKDNQLSLQYQILKLIPESIEFQKVYGEHGFYSAKGKFYSGNIPAEFAFAIGGYAIVNEAAVIKDSLNYYQLLPEFSRGDLFFPKVLDHLIKQEILSATRYAEDICLPVVRAEEANHAQDRLFAQLKLADSEDLADSHILQQILKPTSSFQQEFVFEHQDINSPKVFFRASVMEHAGKLGAVIDIMQSSISKGNDMQAVISFYNYLAEMEVFYDYYKRNQVDYANNQSIYFIVGSHVFSGLADLGIQDKKDLFSKVQFDPLRGINLLRKLYEMDFYADQERRQLLEA